MNWAVGKFFEQGVMNITEHEYRDNDWSKICL